MHDAARSGAHVASLQEDQRGHHDLFALDRQVYEMNRDNLAISASDYISILMDGTYQPAFGIPHFVKVKKGTEGHALKVKLIGIK